jgi:hypothetical protein
MGLRNIFSTLKQSTLLYAPPGLTIKNSAFYPQSAYILVWKPTGTRTRGRPKKSWIADIEEDMQIMGVRRWRKQCEERAEWKKITEKAKTHSGL